MLRTPPPTLVRFHIHMRREHVRRLVQLANALARKKRRDVRLGEALELVINATRSWSSHDLLDLAPVDHDATHWLQLGPVNRKGGTALVPANLRH